MKTSTRIFLALAMMLSLGHAIAEPLVTGPGVKIEAEAIRQEFTGATPQVLQSLAKPEALQQVLSNNYSRQQLAREAKTAGLENNPLVKAAIERARIRVLSDAMLEQIDRKNQPSLKELEAMADVQYKANPQKFEVPEQVWVRHIVIRHSEADAKQKIEAVMADLKAGKDFAEIAKEKSQDPGSAAKGGDLGYFARGRMVPPFEQAAFALQKVGEISDIVETQFGFHILKFEGRKAAGVRPFAEVKEQLMRENESRVINEGRQAQQERLLKDARFNTAAIEALAKEFENKKP